MKLTSSMPPPLNVEDAAIRPANDYKGRKNVFELKAPDGAEFLFDVATPKERDDWVNAIGRAAGEEPAFLDAPSHLYERVWPSGRRSVTPFLR